jgi:LacI family transcriptional regulator
MRHVTQTDIAKALGLSPSTVGLVVGNNRSPLRKHLNKETVRRIEEKAKELGYQPNRAAQVMRGSRTNLIIFLNMGSRAEWVQRQAYQIGMLAHELGYDFQVIDAYWWVIKGNRITDQIIAMRPEGVVISGTPQAEDMDFLRFRQAKIAVVTLDLKLPEIPRVRHDVESAIFELTSSCIAAGRNRIALIVRKGSQELWQVTERRQGFVRALREAGKPLPAEWDVPSFDSKRFDGGNLILNDVASPTLFSPFEPGYRTAQCLGTAVDACIFANDPYAFGALSYYLRNKIRVPGQITLSGFDNLSYTTEGSVPITTVEFPTELMCRKAMKLLIAQIDGSPLGAEDHVFPCKIIWRQSMRKPRVAKPSRSPQ